MGWELGIDKNFHKAPEFFWLFTISVVVGALTILLPNIPLLAVMYFSQVINGVVLPFVLILMSQWSQSPLPAATTVSVLTTFATKARTSKSTTSRVICWASILEKSRISFKMPRSCLAESRTVSR